MFAILLTEGMNPFYQNISSFPTVFFTFFLALTTLYWLVAVLGLISIDILDFDLPYIEGADLDMSNASDLTNANALAGLMLRFGLNGVPVTIIISLISLFGWILSYYAVYFLFSFIPDGLLQYIAGVPVLFLSLYLAAMMTALVIKPLRPLFKKAHQETEKYVLGQVAVVRTSRVDETFGEAVMADGGAGLILKVRSSSDSHFKKGDKVVLFEYVKETNVYRVISEQEFNA
ncbi:MAG: DUF1449 domain-containing protein [Bermanella sp.]